MAEALGQQVDEPPEGWQPVEVLTVAKCLLPEGDESGTYAVCVRSSSGLAPWDIAGLLRAAQIINDQNLRHGYEEDDE